MRLILTTLLSLIIFQSAMGQPTRKYGVLGHDTPELEVSQWIDADGNSTEEIKLESLKDKTVVILAFQSWCPGCHSIGFPTLQRLTEHFKGQEDVIFLAIQTTFEGHKTNTFDKLKSTQDQYNLKIPFGHDSGENESGWPNLMRDYKTGGTPWIIIMDQEHKVVFNNFQIQTKNAIDIITKTLK